MIKPTARTLGSWEVFPGHFGAAHPRVHIKQLRGAFFVCHQESGFGQCIDAEGLVYALRDGSFGVPDSSSHWLLDISSLHCQLYVQRFILDECW